MCIVVVRIEIFHGTFLWHSGYTQRERRTIANKQYALHKHNNVEARHASESHKKFMNFLRRVVGDCKIHAKSKVNLPLLFFCYVLYFVPFLLSIASFRDDKFEIREVRKKREENFYDPEKLSDTSHNKTTEQQQQDSRWATNWAAVMWNSILCNHMQ